MRIQIAALNRDKRQHGEETYCGKMMVCREELGTLLLGQLPTESIKATEFASKILQQGELGRKEYDVDRKGKR